MGFLELKVPPLVVVVLAAALMWLLSWLLPGAALNLPMRTITAACLAVLGAAICAAGVMQFRKARTTVNPMKPDAASSLVDSGIYSWTRNPMYLGMLLILAGWAVFLSNAAVWMLPAGYAWYMNRFQIAPEERILTARFGDSFRSYASQVRRWI